MRENPNKLEDYENYEFVSSCYRTPEYISFERKYRNYIKKHLPEGYTLHKFNNSHFDFSCVIKSDTNDFIYMSISDVRFFPNEWKNNILIRQMENDHDWRGKSNNYTDLKHFTEDIKQLNERGYVSCHSRKYSFEM